MSNLVSKLRVGILFGGKSAEHEVSVQSAKNVLEALDKDKFEPVLVGIDKQGVWHSNEESQTMLGGSVVGNQTQDGATLSGLTFVPGNKKAQLVGSNKQSPTVDTLDVVFPILHGPLGEDGTIQGFLELANVPYVGPGVLGSAVGMDKDVMKRLLKEAGIPIAKYVSVPAHKRPSLDLQQVIEKLGLPLFVKPANMGSSVGVSKAKNETELRQAIDLAFTFDRKVLIEEAVVGDEVECAVLGNDNPEVSIPGRIIPQADFYSYDAKYIDQDGAVLEVPANLPDDIIKKAQAMALQAFEVLCCEGMGRVDMFVTKDGKVIVNEINTIPGFTKISMYPKMWEASGLSYKDLITKLLELAMERFESRQSLQSTK